MKNMFPAGILGSLLTSSRHQERAILAFAWLGSFLGILCIAALERFVINDSEYRSKRLTQTYLNLIKYDQRSFPAS